MNTPWDIEEVRAFVDGELDAPAAARLQAAAREDVALAGCIAHERRLRSALRSEFDPVLAEPVPQQLLDATAAPAGGARVVDFGATRAARPPARQRWSWREWGAMAATLVLGAWLGSLALRAPGALPLDLQQGELLARGDLDAALSTQLAGDLATRTATRIMLSVQAADGTFCRTFELRGTTGLACRSHGRWKVQLLDGGNTATSRQDGFRQAASSLSPALVSAIEALGAGDALTRDQEQQQLRAGWN